ncbi:MAG: hypothetical protein HRT89_01705 [Lentisphaeria bacterium]|nr:hypothetical protein [Lentisphaeria bacterium]NQZ66762.1 hypothetical protein [Lentisphaeria bacterium]
MTYLHRLFFLAALLCCVNGSAGTHQLRIETVDNKTIEGLYLNYTKDKAYLIKVGKHITKIPLNKIKQIKYLSYSNKNVVFLSTQKSTNYWELAIKLAREDIKNNRSKNNMINDDAQNKILDLALKNKALQEILEDPEIVKAMEEENYLKLLTNPKLLKLAKDPDFQKLMGDILSGKYKKKKDENETPK